MNANSDIQGEISNLSDNELSDRLVEFGLMRTPVTSMTRKYLEKQLMTKIKQSQGRWEAEESTESNGINKNNSQRLEEVEQQDNSSFKNDARSNISVCETANLFFAVFSPNDNSDIGKDIEHVSGIRPDSQLKCCVVQCKDRDVSQQCSYVMIHHWWTKIQEVLVCQL